MIHAGPAGVAPAGSPREALDWTGCVKGPTLESEPSDAAPDADSQAPPPPSREDLT